MLKFVEIAMGDGIASVVVRLPDRSQATLVLEARPVKVGRWLSYTEWAVTHVGHPHLGDRRTSQEVEHVVNLFEIVREQYIGDDVRFDIDEDGTILVLDGCTEKRVSSVLDLE